MEPGKRRDDQRPVVAGRPELGGDGNRRRAHLGGPTGSGRDGARQLVPQVAGDRLLRFPFTAFQAARLDIHGRRSAERVGRSRPGDTLRVADHQPGGLPVAARDGLIEHRRAHRPGGRPADRGEPRGNRTDGPLRPALGDRRTELAAEGTPAQPSRE